MIYTYEVETRNEAGEIAVEKRDVIVKSIPLIDQARLALLQRRLFMLIDNISARFCQKCLQGVVEELPESKVSLYRRVLSCFRKERKVPVCDHCGVVKNNQYAYGYELLEGILKLYLIDALREEPGRVKIIHEMSFENCLAVMHMYLGLEFKMLFNYGSIPNIKAYYDIIHGKDDDEAKKKKTKMKANQKNESAGNNS